MPNPQERYILAFYGDRKAEASAALSLLRKNSIKKSWLISGSSLGNDAPSDLKRFSSALLEDEYMVIGIEAFPKDKSVVEKLRSSGQHPIFMLSANSGAAGVVEEQPPLAARSNLTIDCGLLGEAHQKTQAAPKDCLTYIYSAAEKSLLASTSTLLNSAHLGHPVTSTGEWLLDNTYLFEVHGAEIKASLPRRYSAAIPGIVSKRGMPRIYELARELTAHQDFSLRSESIAAALEAYQDKVELNIAELWIFPAVLRLALYEGIARIAVRAASAQDTREHAYFWTNRLATAARMGEATLSGMVETLASEAMLANEQFISVLAEQLHEEDMALAYFQAAMSNRFGDSLSEIVRRQHQTETADRITVANAIGSLRTLGQLDFTEIFVKVSKVEQILGSDPAGNYSKSDQATRDACRKRVEQLASWSGLRESAVAETAVRIAGDASGVLERHAEYYLIGAGTEVLEQTIGVKLPLGVKVSRKLLQHPSLVYLSSLVLLTGFFAFIFASFVWSREVSGQWLAVLLSLAALFPLSEFSVQIINTLVVSIVPPVSVPRMDFRKGIPPDCSTLVAVPMMLNSFKVLKTELERLEARYVGNVDPQLRYALLADFVDTAEQHGDDDSQLLQAARNGIDELNAKYPGGKFYVFHREKVWSESEQAWIGRERKRGKIEDLNKFLVEGSSALQPYPDFDARIVYVITLDADTRLPAETGRRLIESIAHPLNRVKLSEDGRKRLSGYTIIQPRISTVLPSSSVTRFTRIFADVRGTDPYSHVVSDLYQDLFRESIFHGKAIYEVAPMHSLLQARFPDDAILSHDLIEGSFVGVGADTQVELFESLPGDYAAFARRQHRWIRGDWQISPWILSNVPSGSGGYERNPLPVVNRWQILDNLRRSLVAPASLSILFVAWFHAPAAAVSTIVIAIAVGLPSLAPVFDRLARNISRQTHGAIGVREDVQRTLVYLALLPHQAWIALDAIFRVFYRRLVTHRHVLEWQTAEIVTASGAFVSRTQRECLILTGVFAGMTIVVAMAGSLGSALPFLILWMMGPLVVQWLGYETRGSFSSNLSPEDQSYLLSVARRTWRTFDDLVGPDSNWLPPDNVQLALRVETAERTSPTNIGLWLTSLLAASDFSFITPTDLLARCRNTVSTLVRMERYESHWLNWYNTRTLEPLPPRYLSTVDSGNFLACLWVMEEGLRGLCNARSPGPQCLSGIAATLEALSAVMGEDASAALPLNNLNQLLKDDVSAYRIIDRLKQAKLQIHTLRKTLVWFDSKEREASYWVEKLEDQCEHWLAFSSRILGWMDTLVEAPDHLLRSIHPELVRARRRASSRLPSIAELAAGTHVEMLNLLKLAQDKLGNSQSAWLNQLIAEYRQSQAEAILILAESNALAEQLQKLAASMDMAFLYDEKRKLFGIGYEVGTPRVFASHYDLLASECRVGSLAAIAKGDVHVEHWHTLGRPYVSTKQGQMLLSWSGTMFEYLMPLLFTKAYENSFLAEAVRLAVHTQREYGSAFQRPWGISEAAYSALDSNQVYQYRAFGVPKLGLKQGLEGDFVVSPYSSLLALQVDAESAIENLRELEKLKLYGPMGFYESLDYSRPSAPSGVDGVIIYCYMSHHQGMGLTAIANTLLNSVMQTRFHANFGIRSVEPLLFERVPTSRSLLRHSRGELGISIPVKPEVVLERNPNEIGSAPSSQILGNGEFSVLLTNAGAGYTRWRDFDITRWQADAVLDSHGTFFYLKDSKSLSVWSTAIQPMGTHSELMAVSFSASRVKFERTHAGIHQVYEVCVDPDDPIEIRRFEFSNRGLRTRNLELTSYMELSLARHSADAAHPAFSKIFVQTEWIPEFKALVARRRPRSISDPEVWAAHMIVVDANQFEIEYETSREAFIGRDRSSMNPKAMEGPLQSTAGTVLDPAFAIRCSFQLEAREQVEMAFLTLAASSREALMQILEKYAQ
jgi:cyclic beta-1,2-glucan synthetase